MKQKIVLFIFIALFAFCRNGEAQCFDGLGYRVDMTTPSAVLLADMDASGTATAGDTLDITLVFNITRTQVPGQTNFNDGCGCCCALPVAQYPTYCMQNLQAATNFFLNPINDGVIQVSSGCFKQMDYLYNFTVTGSISNFTPTTFNDNTGTGMFHFDLCGPSGTITAHLKAVLLAGAGCAYPIAETQLSSYTWGSNSSYPCDPRDGGDGDAFNNPAPTPIIGILPITLSSFTGIYNEATGKALLQWSTEQEENNKQFILQCKNGADNASQWRAAATVQGAGNSSIKLNYSAEVTQPYDKTLYRLQQQDLDGRSSYSRIIILTKNKTATGISIFPNPVTGNSLTVNMQSNTTGSGRIIITDAAGRQHLSLQITMRKGVNAYKINTETLSSGTYFVKATADDGSKIADGAKLVVTK